MQTLRQIAILLCAGVIFAGCSELEKRAFSPQVSGELAAMGMQTASYENGVVTLTGRSGTIRLKNESRWVEIGNIPITLTGNSTISSEGVLDIPDLIFKTQLEPIIADRRFPIRRIVLDPGHGGSDRGALSAHGADEKKLNLLLAQTIAYELKKRGFEVFLTRSNDSFVSLDERPEAVKKFKADLFVSIHHNSAPRQGACGFEIYSLRCNDPQEMANSGSSANLAYHLYRALAPLNHFPGRGVKAARFKVLRLAGIPAVLLEAGFLSNPVESAYLATPLYRQQFAVKFAETLAKF